MIIQPIVNTAEICARHGIKQVVICPGSRSAPITLAFSRHPQLKTFVIPDERSAGFIALGLAQSSKLPVVIVCTSGTAAANLYPAIIEAFYQQIPLLIFTADRPAEWVDQQDGQTIRQQNIYQNHVLASYQFPVSFDHDDAIWQSEKTVSISINKASGLHGYKGPVHINVPIREPFYPSMGEKFHYPKDIKVINSIPTEQHISVSDSQEIINHLKKFPRVAVVAGQGMMTKHLKSKLDALQKRLDWVVFGDIISNVSGIEKVISKQDTILQSSNITEQARPDLIISFGQSVLSKGLIKYFRKESIRGHWKIGSENEPADTFKSLTKTIAVDPAYFLELVLDHADELPIATKSYVEFWNDKEAKAENFVAEFLNEAIFSEFHATYQILNHLPKDCHLHLANSMPVRYANMIGLPDDINTKVWSNRGASGIDGCISTTVGHALNSERINVVISGDMAFFYDRNGLWHEHLPNNLRIIILNNHGGGIFRLIDGPKQLEELGEFFETRQSLNAENTAKDFGMKYLGVKGVEKLREMLEEFFALDSGPSILEIETDPAINQKVYEDFIRSAKRL